MMNSGPKGSVLNLSYRCLLLSVQNREQSWVAVFNVPAQGVSP